MYVFLLFNVSIFLPLIERNYFYKNFARHIKYCDLSSDRSINFLKPKNYFMYHQL